MPNSLPQRIAGLDWTGIQGALDEQGYAVIPKLLTSVRRLSTRIRKRSGFAARSIWLGTGLG